MTTAFLFPGQGAQEVGMGKDLYEAFGAARRVFDRAEEIASLPLKQLCFEGPEEELSRTDVSQPAIFAVSAAVLAVMDDLLGEAAPRPDCCAGLSLGEYTALYAAGAMDFDQAAKLVTRRGALMQQAAEAVPSGMVCILGLDEPKARELCNAVSDGEVLACANFNCPGQIVLSGQRGACERAAERAEEFGASGAVPLKVAGAFHTELMQPAAEKLGETLAGMTFADPAARVLANVDAEAYTGAGDVAGKLLKQLTSPTRWQQSMEKFLAEGVETFYEIGPGRVARGLMRRIDRRTRVTCLNTGKAVEALAG